MQTSAALVIMMLALAGFAVITARRDRGGADHDQARAQLRGFVYVGAAAAVVLAGCVLGLQARWTGDRAATVAVLGFFGLCLYLVVAFALFWWARRPVAADAGRHVKER